MGGGANQVSVVGGACKWVGMREGGGVVRGDKSLMCEGEIGCA